MIDALFDRSSWPVGRLARHAGVAPSTASEHPEVLRVAGIVTSEVVGREHRFRLADDDVADALERFGAVAPTLPSCGFSQATRNAALREGRTCYDHLAGRLGVALADSLVAARVLESTTFAPTACGERRLETHGIDVAALVAGRRPLARSCLDWSERRPHLAGALGAAVLARLEAVAGVERCGANRAVRLLPPGRELLTSLGAPDLP